MRIDLTDNLKKKCIHSLVNIWILFSNWESFLWENAKNSVQSPTAAAISSIKCFQPQHRNILLFYTIHFNPHKTQQWWVEFLNCLRTNYCWAEFWLSQQRAWLSRSSTLWWMESKEKKTIERILLTLRNANNICSWHSAELWHCNSSGFFDFC